MYAVDLIVVLFQRKATNGTVISVTLHHCRHYEDTAQGY